MATVQTNAALRPNETKVLDCLQWTLGTKVCAANGFYTRRIICDRNLDPRNLSADLIADFREAGTLIRLKVADEEELAGGKGLIGAESRQRACVELICRQALAKDQFDAGVSIDQIQSWLKEDIRNAIRQDMRFQEAISSLNQIAGPWGPAGTFTGPVSVMDWRMKVLAGPIHTFPDAYQVVQLSYLYDTYGAAGTPGSF